MDVAVAFPDLDERALVQTLKTLRELVEEEHALEAHRAAGASPLAFVAVSPARGGSGRLYLFQTSERPGGWAGLRVGDGVEIRGPDEEPGAPFGTIAAFDPAGALVQLCRPPRGVLPQRGLLRPRVDENQRLVRLRSGERVVRERHARPRVRALLTGADALPLEVASEPATALSCAHPWRSRRRSRGRSGS